MCVVCAYTGDVQQVTSWSKVQTLFVQCPLYYAATQEEGQQILHLTVFAVANHISVKPFLSTLFTAFAAVL